jgi:hypothetical protein
MWSWQNALTSEGQEKVWLSRSLDSSIPIAYLMVACCDSPKPEVNGSASDETSS